MIVYFILILFRAGGISGRFNFIFEFEKIRLLAHFCIIFIETVTAFEIFNFSVLIISNVEVGLNFIFELIRLCFVDDKIDFLKSNLHSSLYPFIHLDLFASSEIQSFFLIVIDRLDDFVFVIKHVVKFINNIGRCDREFDLINFFARFIGEVCQGREMIVKEVDENILSSNELIHVSVSLKDFAVPATESVPTVFIPLALQSTPALIVNLTVPF